MAKFKDILWKNTIKGIIWCSIISGGLNIDPNENKSEVVSLISSEIANFFALFCQVAGTDGVGGGGEGVQVLVFIVKQYRILP